MLADVEALLRSMKDQKVVYVPNPGNAGDSFIAHAAYQLFTRVDLSYEIGDPSGYYPGSVIILGGGGNLVRPYPNFGAFLRRNLGKWKQLIILPHTIRAFAEVLHDFDSRCFVFCRERPSFSFVRQHAPKAEVILSHDLAFSCDLDATRWQIRNQSIQDWFGARLLARNAKRYTRTAIYKGRSLGKVAALDAFRMDIERTGVPIPSLNLDLSEAFAADDMSPASSLHATYWLMKFIDQFAEVRTNRLHVGIMSALLGKALNFYDNAYGKNHDVFFHSVAGRFSNVRWHADCAKITP
jgi:exopolysaccharide biosynthesis predicted pyruvyltransferase EpsI